MNTLFILKKLRAFLLSVLFVVTLTFVMMHAIPGSPFAHEQGMTEEVEMAMNRHYGLDKPLYLQYLHYLKNVCCGDLGPSYAYESRTVNDIISDGFPISCTLGLEALFIALSLGITLGTLSALKKKKWQGKGVLLMASMGISIPSMVVATFLQYIFAYKLHWFPLARIGSFAHTVLPALSIAAFPTAFIARLTRTNMIEVLKQDYILTARAKGLTPFYIVRRHILKNGILPILSYIAQIGSALITGNLVVEKVFGVPGLGGWFVKSVLSSDYTAILGLTLFYAVLLNAIITLVEMITPFIDPRIKRSTYA